MIFVKSELDLMHYKTTMTKKNKRIATIIAIFGLIALATSILLTSLSKNVMFFMTPTEIINSAPSPKQTIRVGGLVKNGSFHRVGTKAEFILTDCSNDIKVHFSGVLPSLFREGQGIIATGIIQNNILQATELLAKHDEKYIPKELYNATINQAACKDKL